YGPFHRQTGGPGRADAPAEGLLGARGNPPHPHRGIDCPHGRPALSADLRRISSRAFAVLKSSPLLSASRLGSAGTSGITPLPFFTRCRSMTSRYRGRRKRICVSGSVTSGIIQAVLP